MTSLRAMIRDHQEATDTDDDTMLQILADYISRLDHEDGPVGDHEEELMHFIADRLEQGPPTRGAQVAYIAEQFRLLMGMSIHNPNHNILVDFILDEAITVHFDESLNLDRWFRMDIGSDDDCYRFELWAGGRDTGLYVEFAFEGETL